jgi:amino acid permease
VFGLIAFAVVSYYTLWQLARCGHIVSHLRPNLPAPTYPEIARVAFGKVGMVIAYLGILFGVLGAVGAYFVFIGTTLSTLLCPLSPALTSTVMTLITLPVIVLLSWLRAYRFLAPTSIFGVLALALGLILVLVDGFETQTIQPISKYPLAQPATIPLFLGNAAFVYLIHVVVIPIEQSMQKRKDYPKAVACTTLLVTVGNMVFALLAYFLYGEAAQGNIIENIQPGVRDIIVKVALVIDLVATSALFLLPMFELFESAIWSPADVGKVWNSHTPYRRVLSHLGWSRSRRRCYATYSAQPLFALRVALPFSSPASPS